MGTTAQVFTGTEAGVDFMPLDGIDHVELWVGNAAQASYFFTHAFGFTRGRLPRARDRSPRRRLARARRRATCAWS